jgi:voltage-gated potassium channel
MDTLRKRIDDTLAAPMFVASLLFLLFLAGLLHLHEGQQYRVVALVCHWGVILLHPLFVAELALQLVLESGRWKQNLFFCLLPPLRIGARDHVSGTKIWLPHGGWTTVDHSLRERIEKAFSLPMILIALLVIPLLAIEHFFGQQLTENPTLALATHIAIGLIWFAFAVEFVVMISIVAHKARYCKQHWIDIAVIVLPLVAFMRAARLMRLGRTVRLFRLRGLLMRVYRGVLVLDVIDRLLRIKPERRLPRLEEALAEKQREIDELRTEIADCQAAMDQDPSLSRRAA